MSTAALVPSLKRFVKFAVAMVSTGSVICSAVKYLPSSSRSDAWIELGQAVRVSANLMAARSSSLNTLRPDPPGSLSAWICSSVTPCRFAEAV